MSEATIKRISKVGDYRVFQSWADDHRARDFARVNLIYGTNGSGKSTLASLLRSCASAEKGATRTKLELSAVVDGTETTVTAASDTFWTRVRVFNADYVEENLRFDDSTGPHSDSLLTLGKANVETELELASAVQRRAEVEPLAIETRAASTAANSALDRRMTEVAGRIVDDLRTSPVATYRGTNSYTRRNVRTLLSGDRSNFASASTNVVADRALATSDAPRPYTQLLTGAFPPPERIFHDSVELLSTDVLSRPLEELSGDPEGAAWVQHGLSLHEARTDCLFCGSGITTDRRASLAAHFDQSVTDLQSRITSQLELLKSCEASAEKLANSIPREADLYPDLAGVLRSARSKVQDEVDHFRRDISKLMDCLASKHANPFAAPEYDGTVSAIPSSKAVALVVETHEKRRREHEKEASTAARNVELARVKAFAVEYDELARSAEGLSEQATEHEEELRELNHRIISLSSADADPVPQASELTANVSRLLGRSELAFAPTQDGKHYRIERSGAPATHLSEGERTAIALLHFLASIREGVVAGDEPIVVIDDPVSSLDEGILFGISSFLWYSLVENTYASQVFLLTHNFELFRQWVVQLEGAQRHISGGYTIHEIRMRHRQHGSGTPRRVPQFDPWTSDVRVSSRLRSLYHFLFARVATSIVEATPEISLAERMDVLALAPNAARKMLEAFLSFRFPQHIGKFHAGMKAAINALDDPAVRTHVERYLHAYSHNEEGNVSAMIDPSEATVVLRSLFLLMRANDPRHLSAMCEALGVEEDALFAIPV